jgi:hypothetical protein
LLLLNMRGWKRLSEYRNVWRRNIEGARARCGISSHWRSKVNLCIM